MIAVRNARTADQVAPDVLSLEKMFESYPTEKDICIFIDTVDLKDGFVIDEEDEEVTFYVLYINRDRYNKTADKQALVRELVRERLKDTELKEAVLAA